MAVSNFDQEACHRLLLRYLSGIIDDEVSVGRYLLSIKKHRGYAESGITTWREYLGQPEIGLTERQAQKYIDLYRLFKKYQEAAVELVNHGNHRNLDKLLSSLHKIPEEDREELMYAAGTLSHTDFKERLYDIKTKEQGPRTYEYVLMKRCKETGSLVKVPGIESDEIKGKLDIDA